MCGLFKENVNSNPCHSHIAVNVSAGCLDKLITVICFYREINWNYQARNSIKWITSFCFVFSAYHLFSFRPFCAAVEASPLVSTPRSLDQNLSKEIHIASLFFFFCILFVPLFFSNVFLIFTIRNNMHQSIQVDTHSWCAQKRAHWIPFESLLLIYLINFWCVTGTKLKKIIN